MKLLLGIYLFTLSAFAFTTVNPVATIDINGTAKDMVLSANKLVVATDMGHIEVYDPTSREKLQEISIPDVKDFMGDVMPARVMSTDVIGEQYLLLSDSGKGGYSNLHLFKEGKLNKLLGPEDKEAIIKARFVDETHILLGYLSDEVALLIHRVRKSFTEHS